jgi:endonuclease YncB( thermonuclease family)
MKVAKRSAIALTVFSMIPGVAAARQGVDLCLATPGEIVSGYVERTNVVDGDTFDLAGNRIRPWAINSAEEFEPQRGYEMSRQQLIKLLASRRVACHVLYEAPGRQKRCVATCDVQTVGDLGEAMLRDGWVCILTKFIRQQPQLQASYEQAQRAAMREHRGLWSLWATTGVPKFCRH